MSLASNYLPVASLYPLREPIQAEDSNRRQERRQGDAPSCPPMKGGSHISTMARVTRANEICETIWTTASWLTRQKRPGRDPRALGEAFELGPDDLGFDFRTFARHERRSEAAVAAGDHAFASDDFCQAQDALGRELGMLDDDGSMGD